MRLRLYAPEQRWEIDVGAKRDTMFRETATRAEGAARQLRLAPGVSPAGSAGSEIAIETSHAEISLRQSSGLGLPLVLLHGNSSSKDIFDAQFRGPLGQSHRLIAIDLPGHGASSDAYDPEQSYGLPGYADAVVQVLESLGLESGALVGWSLGGHVALEMMSSFPGIVGAMLIGTPPFASGVESLQAAFQPHPLAMLAGQADLSEDEVLQFARAAGGAVHGAALEGFVRRTDGRARALMFRSLLAGAYADERQIVETSDVPIAIVNGAEDPLINGNYIRSIVFANLWGSRCHMIPRAGHAPFLEAAAVFNTLLSSFASDMEARATHLAENPPLTYSA